MKLACGWIGFLGLLAAACNGGGDDGAAPIDAPAGGSGLAGSWVRVPVVGDDGVERITFTASTWTAEGSFGTDSGRYQIDAGDWLWISGGVHFASEGAFLLDGDQLLIIAYEPVGAVTGLVGTWRASYSAGGSLVDQTILLNGDGSASRTTIARDSEQTDPGTWTAETGGFALDLGAAAPQPLHFRTLGNNAAVGTLRFDRAP